MFYMDEKTKEIFVSSKEIENPKILKLNVKNEESLHEKHMPKIEIENNHVKVKIGDIMHPMTPEHYITLIALETNLGSQLRYLTYTNKPVVDFFLTNDEEVKAVYEYCTLHGLWKLEV